MHQTNTTKLMTKLANCRTHRHFLRFSPLLFSLPCRQITSINIFLAPESRKT